MGSKSKTLTNTASRRQALQAMFQQEFCGLDLSALDAGSKDLLVVSFCPKFAALVSAMPTATIGGVSLILYGMISAVGVRNVVENQVDFTNTRNVIIAALILVLAIGINYSGSIQIGIVSLSGLAVASIIGIALNAILPGKDYEFEQEHEGSTSVDLSGAVNMEENL